MDKCGLDNIIAPKPQDAEVLPFHKWKDEIRKKEHPLVRPKNWYYTEYGRYCSKHRKA